MTPPDSVRPGPICTVVGTPVVPLVVLPVAAVVSVRDVANDVVAVVSSTDVANDVV